MRTAPLPGEFDSDPAPVWASDPGVDEGEPAAPTPPPESRGGEPPRAPTKRRVLVVDDEPDIGDILAAALGRVGYDVRVSLDDRLDGVELTSMDLALVDMYGPRHEGKEVIRQVRRCAPHAVVIAMSGDPSLAGRYAPVGAAQVGADAVLTKPFEIKDVVELCARLLAGIASP